MIRASPLVTRGCAAIPSGSGRPEGTSPRWSASSPLSPRCARATTPNSHSRSASLLADALDAAATGRRSGLSSSAVVTPSNACILAPQEGRGARAGRLTRVTMRQPGRAQHRAPAVALVMASSGHHRDVLNRTASSLVQGGRACGCSRRRGRKRPWLRRWSRQRLPLVGEATEPQRWCRLRQQSGRFSSLPAMLYRTAGGRQVMLG